MELEGRAALITGGNSGIGEATAILFAREGAQVAVASRRAEANAAVVERIESEGGSALSIPCDVTDPDSVAPAVATTVDRFGGIDILVNNAGVIYRDKNVLETSLDEWNHTIAVNTTGTFLVSRAVIPHMIEKGRGSIVNNASYFGLVGGRGTAAYSASKGAVVLLTKAMALDHARQGIRVNCVCPGSVETPMMRQEMEEMGGEAEVRHLFEEKHPLGRISQPEEIARAILYLASDAAAFVTGAALPIDGGLTAG
jgi:NAD(P)-dependent dehydrogenase (short-subunit alcohol dehydrogenase family)